MSVGFSGTKRQHRKVSGAKQFWIKKKQECKEQGILIPKGTRAPGSAISKRS